MRFFTSGPPERLNNGTGQENRGGNNIRYKIETSRPLVGVPTITYQLDVDGSADSAEAN